jgi:hypothetical protein
MLEFLHMKAILFLMAVLVAPVMGEDEDSEEIVADFAGGVLGKSAVITGKNTAVTSDGKFISFNGKGFATSDGYYGMNRNQVWGNGKLVVKSKNLFYGTSSSWKNGNSYTSDGKSQWITKKKSLDY